MPEAVLSPDELGLIDAYWRAANYLSVGQIYLLDNPLLREPLRRRARQAAAARALGHHARAEPAVRAPEPGHPASATSTRSSSPAPATAGPGWSPTPTWRAPTARSTPRIGAGRGRACGALFRQFSFPGGIPSHVAPETPGLDPRGRRARLRAACTPTAPRSTTPTCWSPAWSATARPRPARWPPAGTRTSSSTRSPTARCCRSCTSTATRSPTRPCWPASPTTSSPRCCAATATSRTSSPATTRPTVHQQLAATLDAGARRDRRDPATARASAAVDDAAALADDRAAHAEGLDRAEARSTASRSRAPSARTRCRWPTRATNAEHRALLEEWLRSYRPEELFDREGALRAASCRRLPRTASGG